MEGQRLELFPLNLASYLRITALGGIQGDVYTDTSWVVMEKIQQVARTVPKEKGQRPLNEAGSWAQALFQRRG